MLGGAGVAAASCIVGIHAAVLGQNSDFNCFHDAAVAATFDNDIYTAGSRGYIYPPMLAAIIAPLGRLELRTAAMIWTVLMTAMLVLVARQAARNVRDAFVEEPPREAPWNAAALGVILVSPTLFQEFKQGNCDLLVLLGVVLAQGWVRRRPVLSGLALGFAVNIKYLPLVYLPYLLFNRRWVELASSCLGIVLFALAPAFVFGWEHNLDYLHAAYSGMASLAGRQPGPSSSANIHPLAWRSSISLPSVLARAADAGHLPGPWVLVGVAGIAAVFFVVCASLYRRAGIPMLGRPGGKDESDPARRAMAALEWPALLTAALIFSPQTVARHANMALPMAVAGAWLLLDGRTTQRKRLLVGSGVLLMGQVIRFWVDRPDGPLEPWRAVGGLSWCLMAAALIVLNVGLDEAGRLNRPGGASATPAR